MSAERSAFLESATDFLGYLNEKYQWVVITPEIHQQLRTELEMAGFRVVKIEEEMGERGTILMIEVSE